jgi:hypothetical protein
MRGEWDRREERWKPESWIDLAILLCEQRRGIPRHFKRAKYLE